MTLMDFQITFNALILYWLILISLYILWRR